MDHEEPDEALGKQSSRWLWSWPRSTAKVPEPGAYQMLEATGACGPVTLTCHLRPKGLSLLWGPGRRGKTPS